DASTLSVALASALHAHQGSPQNGKGVVPGCVGTYSVYPRERGYVLGPQAVTSHVSREERPAIRSQRSIWSGVRVTPPEAASLDQATVSSPALDCEQPSRVRGNVAAAAMTMCLTSGGTLSGVHGRP